MKRLRGMSYRELKMNKKTKISKKILQMVPFIFYSDDKKLLKAEADKQMKEFLEEIDEGTLPLQEELTEERELALYIAGIRLINGLPLIIPETVEHKTQILEMLETSIQEYSTRKKVDTIMRLQKNLDRTSSKQQVKREESKGIHELLERSNRKMDGFSKEVVSEKEKT